MKHYTYFKFGENDFFLKLTKKVTSKITIMQTYPQPNFAKK